MSPNMPSSSFKGVLGVTKQMLVQLIKNKSAANTVQFLYSEKETWPMLVINTWLCKAVSCCTLPHVKCNLTSLGIIRLYAWLNDRISSGQNSDKILAGIG